MAFGQALALACPASKGNGHRNLLHRKTVAKKPPSPDRVSEAFRRVMEDLRQDRDADPALRQKSPGDLLRTIGWALLLALIISMIGTVWIELDWP